MQLPKGLKQFVLFVLLIGSYSYIVYKLYKFDNWHTISVNSSQLILSSSILLILLIFNLFFEAKKWQTLLKPIVTVKLNHALRMVFAGFTSGILTPFKAGEPLGKIAFLDKSHRKDAVIMSYFGSFLQNIVILVCGIVGLVFHSQFLNINIENKWLYLTIPVIAIIIYLAIKALPKQNKLITYISTIKDTFSKLSFTLTFYTFIYSCLRYFTFCIQLYLCLYLFGISSIDFSTLFIYYLLITLFPSHLLVDIGIRGSVSIFVLNNNSFNADILLAVFLVWIINQALPTLIGTSILVRKYYINIHKRTQSA